MLYRTWLATGVMTGVALVVAPAIAHEVQIQNDVGATLHIEPNDIPLAGASTEVWFALTKAGGTIIPLNDCDCTLTLYDEAQSPIEEPSLSPVSAEGFVDIPGATVMFPEVGAYELVLSGAPQGGTEFEPFELRYEVTVAGRASASETTATQPDDAAAPETASSPAETLEDPPGESSIVTPDADSGSSETAETPIPVSSSTNWRQLLFWGAGILVLGIVGGMLMSLSSPGEKS